MLLDAAEDEGGVALADLGNEDADGLAAAVAKGASGEIGAVVEALGGGVAFGMDCAAGAALRTRETAAVDKLRCWARALRLTGMAEFRRGVGSGSVLAPVVMSL